MVGRKPWRWKPLLTRLWSLGSPPASVSHILIASLCVSSSLVWQRKVCRGSGECGGRASGGRQRVGTERLVPCRPPWFTVCGMLACQLADVFWHERG